MPDAAAIAIGGHHGPGSARRVADVRSVLGERLEVLHVLSRLLPEGPRITCPTSRIGKLLNRNSFSLVQRVVSGPASVSRSRAALRMPFATSSRSK